MSTSERAKAMIQDILVNHLPRIKEGLEKGYVDENQILVMYDHAVRARILQECDLDNSMPGMHGAGCCLDEHEDALSRINTELAAQADEFEAHVPGLPPIKFKPAAHPLAVMAETDKAAEAKVYQFKLNKTPWKSIKLSMTGSELRTLLPEDKAGQAIFQEATGNDPDIQIADGDSVEVVNKEFYSVPPATFGTPPPMHVKEVKGKFVGSPKKVGNVPVPKPLRGEREHATMLDEANFHRAHVDKLECICGGLIHDDPQFTGDVFLECGSCGRTFLSEFELAEARKTETKKATKCVDATYFTTGTLAGGTDPVPMETEISLNGRKTTIKAKDGKFTLTYEQIVRMAVNQRRDPLNAFTGSDAELPMETAVFHHRVQFKDLPGERDGSLWKGQTVECTPGMVIECIGTGNA